MRCRRALLGVAVSASTVGVGLIVWLDLAPHGRRDMSPVQLTTSSMAILLTAVLGWRVLRSRPGHRIGQILVGTSLAGMATTLLEVYAFAGLVNPGHRLPLDRAADVASSASWVTAYAALTVLAFCFPDGKLPSPGWRPFAWVLGGSFVLAWLAATVQPGRQDEPFEHMLNPAGQAWLGGAGQVLVGLVMVTMLVVMAIAAGAVAERYDKSEGVERLQLKWLAYSITVVPVALAACYLGDWLLGSHAVASVTLELALILIPSSVAVAVLRYRLYDIDRLINRTVVYVGLTATLGALFTVITLGVGLVAGRGSALATGVATLVTVVAFRPARARLQDLVDRRFSRAAYDGRRLEAGFADDLRRDRADPADVDGVLARALGRPGLAVALWVPSDEIYVSVDGSTVVVGDHDGGLVHQVELGGVHHALLLFPDGAAPPADLLSAVVAEARLALQIAALRAEVIAQSAAAAEARVRVAEATFEERRRLERDLHDGAQQRLVYLGIMLRRLQRSLPTGARVLEPALDQAVDQVSDALADLRNLSRGQRPVRLSRGLRPALEDLAATAPLPVRLTLTTEEAPPEVEAVAYFVACEAVTNAVKHARANSVELVTAMDQNGLCVTVRDDGVGGAEFSPGRGLSGLRGRVEAHQGALEIDSSEGRGTEVKATIPCG